MNHRRKPIVWVLVLFLAAASLGQAPRPADTPRFFPAPYDFETLDVLG